MGNAYNRQRPSKNRVQSISLYPFHTTKPNASHNSFPNTIKFPYHHQSQVSYLRHRSNPVVRPHVIITPVRVQATGPYYFRHRSLSPPIEPEGGIDQRVYTPWTTLQRPLNVQNYSPDRLQDTGALSDLRPYIHGNQNTKVLFRC
ncbi:unnamed protein product [Rotaria sp. Silwood2]|nr:unnamed protein product [Rotaria sp. Silwood2]CAF4154372.1 unnamed protein product [Rotaria sp. Silwood2]